MIELIFQSDDGEETTVQVESGTSLMDAAVDNDVDGILGDCGGAMTCGTCHVFVLDSGEVDLGAPGPEEDDMLDGVATPRQPRSRLACQIELTDELQRLQVAVPKTQW